MTPLWPFGRRGRASPPEEPATPAPVDFHSHALGVLLRRLAERRDPRVLDLGSAHNINLAFFGSRGVGYAVEDALRTLAPCRSAGTFDPGCAAALPDLLRFPDGTAFDAIFAWDLLDFVGAPVIRVLAERLLPWCRQGCLLYALVSRASRLPGEPGRWEILGESRIRYIPAAHPRALPSPRYTQAALEQAMAPFRVERAYLLKLGMQEYLLGLRAEGAAERPAEG
ncbi:MAG TPA: hypothetical protein VMT16_08395 [Thermoanaerobaculia bacterium]|nr:hypothetical protein [Thermoanaerobaculia bacterium]